MIRPGNTITRAEACTIVNCTLGCVPHEEHLLAEDEMRAWPDNCEGAWYYEQMQEAPTATTTGVLRLAAKLEEWTEQLEDRDWTALEHEWSDANSTPSGEIMD